MISKHLIRFVFNLLLHFRWWSAPSLHLMCMFFFHLSLVACNCVWWINGFFDLAPEILIWWNWREVFMQDGEKTIIFMLGVDSSAIPYYSVSESVCWWMTEYCHSIEALYTQMQHKQQMDACKASKFSVFSIRRSNLNSLL